MLGSYHPRNPAPPKPGHCQISMVTQGRCRRKATEQVGAGLKSGQPLHLCAKCAQHVRDMLSK